MNTASNATQGTTNSLTGAANRAHQLVDTVADKAAPALQAATTTAHQTIDSVAAATAPAAEWVASGGKRLADNGAQLADACTGYVRTRPLASVAGALAIGYFVGRMMR